MDNNQKIINLKNFQNFLENESSLNQKHIPFYINWIRQFWDFTKNTPQDEDKIKIFTEHLRENRNINDWQIKQAKKAINYYYNLFLPKKKDISVSIDKITNKVSEEIKYLHYSPRTEKTYINWIKQFFYYFNKIDPNKLDSSNVKDFLSHLALERKVSASTQNQAFNALLFLFHHVLKKDFKDLKDTVRAKQSRKIPVVLSRDEVNRLFESLDNTYLLICKLIYGSGLRLMEGVNIRVHDICFDTNKITVRSGKGDKDRVTMLPKSIKDDLKKHLIKVKELHDEDLKLGYGEVSLPFALDKKYPNAGCEWGWQWIFPAKTLTVDKKTGKVFRWHFHESNIQKSVREAARKARLIKHVTVHTLRHSFATHLLESGYNIRTIQELLGHKDVKTTMIYTHVLNQLEKDIESPLDL
jgi:integron integrase